MASGKWIKVDKVLEHRPYWIDVDNDLVFYMHEKLKGGYELSPVNQKIVNFKHKREKFGTGCWKHKIAACQEFAEDLATLDSDVVITAIPTSKHLDDPDFDPRFKMLFNKLRPLVSHFQIIENLIVRTETVQALHAENSSTHRNPDTIIQKLHIADNAPSELDELVLVDDVLTSGANFKACERLLKQHYPNIRVYGLFWAMMKHE